MKHLDFLASALIGILVGRLAPLWLILTVIAGALVAVAVLLVMSRANEGFK